MKGLPPTHQVQVARAVLLARPPTACPSTCPRLRAHTRAHSSHVPWYWHSDHARRPHVLGALTTGHRASPVASRGAPRPTAPRRGPLPYPSRWPINAAARAGPAHPGESQPAIGTPSAPTRGAGVGVNEMEAIPPPPRLPSPPCAARPLGLPVQRLPTGYRLHPTLASDYPRPGPRIADRRWPSAARCPSASWRGRTCQPRTCERCGVWEPQLYGEGRCP